MRDQVSISCRNIFKGQGVFQVKSLTGCAFNHEAHMVIVSESIRV